MFSWQVCGGKLVMEKMYIFGVIGGFQILCNFFIFDAKGPFNSNSFVADFKNAERWSTSKLKDNV